MSKDNVNEKAKVRASASIKINLGNYESAGVEAGIELPCDIQDVPKEFERAWAEVYRQLELRVAEIKKGRNL